MSTVTPTPSTLDPTVAALDAAAHALAVWHGEDTPARVRAGQDAVTGIDATLRALYTARSALLAEIHADQIDRAVRVDELLARLRAGRAGYEREDPISDDPLPPGVEGCHPGRRSRCCSWSSCCRGPAAPAPRRPRYRPRPSGRPRNCPRRSRRPWSAPSTACRPRPRTARAASRTARTTARSTRTSRPTSRT